MKFNQRRSFKKIRGKYGKMRRKARAEGVKMGKVRLTQSTLLFIQPISAATTTYKFRVLESEVPVLPAEIRLNQNDEFISYEVGYYPLGDILDAGGVAVGTHHHSYAPMELDASFAQLTGAWRATMQILVNKISYLENWDMKKHNCITRTQWASQMAAENARQPSNNFEDEGALPMQPMLTISGAKKNDIIITLNTAITPASAGAWTSQDGDVLTITATQLALYFRGMLAQNASKFQ